MTCYTALEDANYCYCYSNLMLELLYQRNRTARTRRAEVDKNNSDCHQEQLQNKRSTDGVKRTDVTHDAYF